MSTTYIAIKPELNPVVTWLRLGRKGNVLDQGQGSLQNLAQDHKGDAFHIVMPAAWSRRVSVNVPTRNRNQAMQAIPYMLEDQVAEDIDKLHFAIGAQDKENNYSVLITRKADMSRLMTALSDAKIKPQRMISALQGLPHQDEHWTIVQNADKAIIRIDEHNVSEVPQAMLAQIFPLLQKEHGAPKSIDIYGDLPTGSIPDEFSTQTHALSDTEQLNFIVENQSANQPVNMLQGAYQTENPLFDLLKPWKWIAIFAGLLFFGSTAVKALETSNIKSKASVLESRIEKTYKRALPGKRYQGASLARKELSRALGEARNGSNQGQFLQLNASLAKHLKSAGNIKINSMTYAGNKSTLTIEVEAPQYQTIEAFRQQLEQDVAEAKLVSSSEQDGRHSGRIKLSQGLIK